MPRDGRPSGTMTGAANSPDGHGAPRVRMRRSRRDGVGDAGFPASGPVGGRPKPREPGPARTILRHSEEPLEVEREEGRRPWDRIRPWASVSQS